MVKNRQGIRRNEKCCCEGKELPRPKFGKVQRHRVYHEGTRRIIGAKFQTQ